MRMMNKIGLLLLLLTASFLLCFNFSVSTATEECILFIGEYQVETGNSISIPVELKSGTDVGACDLTLFFVPSVVTVSNVSGGDFDQLFHNLGSTTTGFVRIGAFQGASPGLNGDIVVADVTFIAAGDISSSTKLSIVVKTLKDASPACNSIPYTVRNGSLTVREATPKPGNEGRGGGGGGGGGGASIDTDGDGYGDIEEMISGTDPNDPCDPDPNCIACLAVLRLSASGATQTPTPTVMPVVATPTHVPTPTPTPAPAPKTLHWFLILIVIAVIAIAGLAIIRLRSK